MPAATQNHLHTPRVRNGEPQPAPVPANEPVSARRDLTSWWKTFSKRAVKKEEEQKGNAPFRTQCSSASAELRRPGVPYKAEF